MKINKVTINNFRNIKHAEYDLKELNIFEGPNKQGKTNSILAIYWAMTDFLIDGTSDYSSFKPLHNTKEKVSVELEFDSFKLKKEFYEKWVKTRGSDEETMAGHNTDYYIDDIKTKVTDAKKELLQKFGIERKTNISKFDLLRAVIDPYYIAKNDWKITRQFIIELVGDVKNEDILNSNPELLQIATRLSQDNYDTDKSKKFYKQQAKLSKDDIAHLEGFIEGLETVHDVSKSDLENAQSEIENINQAIANVKTGKKDTTISEKMQKELQGLMQKALDMETSERAENDALNEDTRKAKEVAKEEMNQAQKMREQTRDECIKADNNVSNLDLEINKVKLNIATKEKDIEYLRKSYLTLKGQAVETQEVKCPNCGYILNQNAIDTEKQNRDDRLNELTVDGKNVSLELQNLKLKLEKLQSDVQNAELIQNENRSALNEANEILSKAEEKYQSISERPYLASQKLNYLKTQIESKRAELANQRMIESRDTSIDDSVINLKKQQEIPQQIINQHIAYITNQAQIENVQKRIKDEQKQLMKCEQSIALIEQFIQLKLEAFQEKIASVFGKRIHFTLIEPNIKEGSWNEVCYSSVCDKDTPFLSGSGSEQIITGIYIAECIKRKLGIDDLPYIFDECDKLDTQSIQELGTKAQIITTKVNDIQYDKLTLNAKEGR